MNGLSVFQIDQSNIRVHSDENNEPWFVAKDVCAYFGESHYRRAIGAVDRDLKGVTHIDTPGGVQQTITINEAGLYQLLFSMQPQKAPGVSAEYKEARMRRLKTFRRWVTAEVLPAIRRDGGYIAAKPDEPDEVLLARAVIVANATMERQKKRLEELENTVTEMTPHAEYSKKVLSAENLHTVNSIGVHLGISAQKLNKFLVAQGWIYKQGLVYCPSAKIRDLGYCDYHIVPYNACGEIHTREHLKWTEKGRKAVIELWNSANGVLPMAI